MASEAEVLTFISYGNHLHNLPFHIFCGVDLFFLTDSIKNSKSIFNSTLCITIVNRILYYFLGILPTNMYRLLKLGPSVPL